MFCFLASIRSLQYKFQSKVLMRHSQILEVLEKPSETDKEQKMTAQLIVLLCCLVALEVCPHHTVILNACLFFMFDYNLCLLCSIDFFLF